MTLALGGRLQATGRKMFEAALLAPARKIVGAQRQAVTTGEHISNDAVRAEVELPTARALVDVARVRFAARLQKQADPSLRAFLQADGGRLWREELRSALGIMQAMLAPALDGLPPLLSEAVLRDWLCFAERRPAYWRTLLQRWSGLQCRP